MDFHCVANLLRAFIRLPSTARSQKPLINNCTCHTPAALATSDAQQMPSISVYRRIRSISLTRESSFILLHVHVVWKSITLSSWDSHKFDSKRNASQAASHEPSIDGGRTTLFTNFVPWDAQRTNEQTTNKPQLGRGTVERLWKEFNK